VQAGRAEPGSHRPRHPAAIPDLNANALTLLVGEPIPIESRILTAVEPDFVRAVAPGLPADLLINRPDVLAPSGG